jgi:hypothetical protein
VLRGRAMIPYNAGSGNAPVATLGVAPVRANSLKL